MVKLQRALISVSDKQGIAELARILNRFNVEIIASSGTAELLKKARIPAKKIESISSFPEILGGRVKTIHPKIFGGILSRRTKADEAELRKHKIKPIDLIVVNLYPFKETASKTEDMKSIIEKIDIGGVALLRAAAKNFERVAVVSSPKQYAALMDELIQSNGRISFSTRERLAVEAFSETAAYETIISQFFWRKFSTESFPEKFTASFEKIMDLRYGENYQQKGSFYKEPAVKEPCIAIAEVMNGKQLSLNNIFDADAAIELVKEFREPAAVIIKHGNPCGAASSNSVSDAFRKALACDPASAFGGIIAFNRKCDTATAKKITSFFNEIVIAPDFDSVALNILKRKKNLRVLRVNGLDRQFSYSDEFSFKKVVGGLLLQERDTKGISSRDLKFVSKKKPSKKELSSMLFAWRVAKHAKSNAIVLAKENQTIGIGAGQTSRVEAVKIAIGKAGKRAQNSVIASDGFFPFADSIELAAKAGVAGLIEPGGSVKDEEVVKAANKAKISLVFTGIRHFRH